MQKSHAQHTSAADESIFLLRTDSYGSSIKAASWNEAMEKAAKYVAESDHPGDIYEEQQISYTVYRLPAGTPIWQGNVAIHILDVCESQDATYLEGWAE